MERKRRDEGSDDTINRTTIEEARRIVGALGIKPQGKPENDARVVRQARALAVILRKFARRIRRGSSDAPPDEMSES